MFRAWDPVTRRNVAIKVLLTENDPDMLARFFIEVQATAKLKHKNIVTIYDFNEKPPYIVMELVEGESLQQVISRRAPFSLLQKVRILSQAAEGLVSAHQSGIVHRDIKPANMMVLPNGDVKIMDFGIARVTGETEARRTRQGDLIGTILYMSPERIQGSEADACGDIFSFGVVGYELITGKHPFEGKDYASVIYKITSEDPPPVHKLVPDCPEVLDLVLQRATAKDREVRYQRMDEILFDLKPVLLELEHQQAAAMMLDLQKLIESGQLAEAQEKVRGVLELDPTNREARQVHETLLRDQRKRMVRAKVETLIREGSEELEKRQFNKAIQSFEAALKLDPETQVGELLGQAKAALEANRQASRLLSEARREMLAGNLDAAHENAALAAEADPRHLEAAGLRDRLRQQIEQRDRQMRVERALRRADELLAHGSFEEARAALAEVEADASPETVRDYRLRIDVEQAEQARRAREQRVQNATAKATQLLHANLLAEAEDTLHALLEEFPDATGAGQLLASIQQHIEAQRRAEAIGKIAQQATPLLQAQNFAEARRVLESGLETFPADTVLGRLLDRALELQKGFERTQGITQTLREAQELRAAGKIEGALARVGQGLATYGPEITLNDLKRQLEFEHEQQVYAAGLREALAKGQRLIEEGKFAEAAAGLETSAAKYPGEPELASLLALARHAQAQLEEKQKVSQTLAQVEALGRRQDWRAALECAEEALQSYPYNSSLSEAAARAREQWRQQQRQQNVERRRVLIEQALDAGNLARAANELRTAREDFPDETAFAPLEERLRQGRIEAQLAALEQEVNQSMARGDWGRAAQQLSDAQACADHPRWKALQKELSRRQEYEQAVERARQLSERGEFDAAEQLLRPLLLDNPPDNQAASVLESVALGRRRLESERAYHRALEEADRLRAAGDFNRAEKILQDAIHQALDQRAEVLLKTVIAERGHLESQQRLEQGKRDVRGLLDRGSYTDALAAIGGLERDFSGEPELARLRAEAERQRRLAEALAAIRDLEQRQQFEPALGVAEKALEADPENRELLTARQRLRQAALEQWSERVGGALEKNDLERVQALLEQGKPLFGQEARWEGFRKDLEHRQAKLSAARQAELARNRVEQSIREGRKRADALKSKGKPQEALEVLDALCRQYPDHAGLAQDRRAVLRMIEIDFVNHALSRITELQAQQKWDAALDEAERAAARYPENAELAAAAAEERRRKELGIAAREISEALAAHDWATAERRLQAAEIRFPGERALARLREELRNGRVQDELGELASTVRAALLEGRLDDAARMVTEKAVLASEPAWQILKQELELHRTYSRTLTEAEQLRQTGMHERAEELLRHILKDAPDTRAAAQLRMLTAERLQKAKEEAIAAARHEAERLETAGRIQEALGVMDRICREYPDDYTLAGQRRELEGRAEAQRQQELRQEADRKQAADRARRVASCRATVEAAVTVGDFEQARTAIDEADRELPGDAALAEIRQQVEARRRGVALHELTESARQSFARRDLNEVARLLAATRRDFSGERAWQEVDEQLTRGRQYGSLLTQAQELIVAARYDEAQQKLRAAMAVDPADGRADALLKDIAAERNPRLRLKTQFRVISRRHRRAMRVGAIAAGVLLGLVVAVYVRHLMAPPPPITLLYQPAQVQLSYSVGAGELPRATIEFQPADVEFQASTDDSWMTVSPASGKRLGRLEVRVSKPPNAGSYSASLVVRTQGRPVTNDLIAIPVHLEVTSTEASKAPPPQLEVLPKRPLDFIWKQGTALPDAQALYVSANVPWKQSVNAPWLLVKAGANGSSELNVSVAPAGMPPRVYTSQIVITAPSSRNIVDVRLTVLPPDAKQPSPKIEQPPPKVEPPVTDQPVDCGSKTYDWYDNGNLIWSGELPPNATLVVGRNLIPVDGGGTLKGKHLPGCDVTLQVNPPVEITERPNPNPNNNFSRLRLKNNTGAPLRSLSIDWRVRGKQ